MEKRWTILTPDSQKVAQLQSELKIRSSLCRMFVQRGLTDYESANRFFNPDLDKLHDPCLMKDMKLAVERIMSAIQLGEKILVYGDYDVDGTTAVAMVYLYLKKIHNPELLQYYIPDRYTEGYGISKQGIDYAIKNDFKLVISLDCGIKSVELVQEAKQAGLDFIICDHHLPGDKIPAAAAILNPKQPDCNYPYKELCGCGVAFKLIQALSLSLGLDKQSYFCYLDLAATAIGADIVPITGENRILAFHGLKKINKSPLTGIDALIKVSGHEGELTITTVVFLIAPRVNAAGRMGHANMAVELFIETDANRALELASGLHQQNKLRKEQDEYVTKEALEIISNDERLINRKTSVLYKDGWHKGVLGIVASRLIETYHRPTIVLTKGDDYAAGSGRSVPGFNLYEAISSCSEHLIKFGGHAAAAGLTIHPENISVFSEKFEEIVASTIDPILLMPEIIIDSEISFDEIDQKFFNTINRMEPFGPENNRPVFLTRNVLCDAEPVVLKEKHLRFFFKCSDKMLGGIGFQLAHKLHLFQHQQPLDFVYTIDQNLWNGRTFLQLKVMDFKPSTSH